MRSERLRRHIHEVIFRGMAMLPVHQILGAGQNPPICKPTFSPHTDSVMATLFSPVLIFLENHIVSGGPKADA